MKRIKLTQNKYALVDDEDFEWLNQWRWAFSHGYAKRGIYINKKIERVYMHRLIMGNSKNITDHIDRDKLNNQRKNLRLVNKQFNGLNRDKNKNNTSGYKGVQWDKQRDRWVSRIMLNGRVKQLGSFKSKEEANICRINFDRSIGVLL